MNRAELQRLANERIQDAKALLVARRWSAAYYLAGYAVECGLKACIAKLMKAEEFPDKGFAEKCWTHDLDRLVVLAGLRDQRDADSKVDFQFRENWATVNEWDESSRYARPTRPTPRNCWSRSSTPSMGCCRGSSCIGRTSDRRRTKAGGTPRPERLPGYGCILAQRFRSQSVVPLHRVSSCGPGGSAQGIWQGLCSAIENTRASVD